MAYGQPWTQPGRNITVDSTLNVEVDPTLPAGGVGLSELSTAAKTNCVSMHVAGFNASVNEFIFVAPSACTIGNVLLVSDTPTSSSDASNKYDFQVNNATASLDLLSVAGTTNGAELAADTPKQLTPDQNATVAQGDVIKLVITKTGTPTNLGSADVHISVIYVPTA